MKSTVIRTPESTLLNNTNDALLAVYYYTQSGECCPRVSVENMVDHLGMDMDIAIASLNMLAAFGVIERHQSRLRIEYYAEREMQL